MHTFYVGLMHTFYFGLMHTFYFGLMQIEELLGIFRCRIFAADQIVHSTLEQLIVVLDVITVR
jgi:hypothetical protein